MCSVWLTCQVVHIPASRVRDDDAIVVHGDLACVEIHPDTIQQRFDRLAAAARLSRITFHDLRHSYATGALKAGVSAKVVSDRIGHANVGFFLQTYAHVLGNDDRDAAEQAASFLIGDGRRRRRRAR
jgi:integrase